MASFLAGYDEKRHSASPEIAGDWAVWDADALPAPALSETTLRRAERKLGAWRWGSRMIAIAQIAQRPGKVHQANVLEMALMQVSEQWIPLSSDLEGKVEQKLRDEGRKFDEPLRYDAYECAARHSAGFCARDLLCGHAAVPSAAQHKRAVVLQRM
ncbi:DUF1173 family protein [Pseudomonas oryzihabitans]|uniref:DUF1173 family protein n=1 Tax=Pseudomonas oryzihabitans TaxID=47885 RepID=UPI001ABFA344|nr:DUF1173 family protein [Pseudomonas oryzihabitans]